MKLSKFNVSMVRNENIVIYNGVSGAVVQLPHDAYEEIQRCSATDDEPQVSTDILERLALGRMIIPEWADEVAFLERRYQASRGAKSRLGLTIVTSLGCNFDCPYCFEAKHPSIMDADVRDLVLQVLTDQLENLQNFHVTWFGGEPLVGKKALLDLSDEFIKACDGGGVRYSANMLTNGYLLDETTCSQLADSRVTSVQVGLDGPPKVHNKLRPLAGGKGTFSKIVENLHHAVSFFDVSVRVNVDKDNFRYTEELMRLLADEGLSGKLHVYPGQIVGDDTSTAAPSVTYEGKCFVNKEFALAERDFFRIAESYGFTSPALPKPTGAPCTAVRANELVVGSKGELYKCWNSVGNRMEEIGNIRDYTNPNGRMQRWLKYDPFSNEECRTCVALPVCMGGCAHYALTSSNYENRCGTFRHTYQEQVESYVASAAPTYEAGFLIAPQSLSIRAETR
ncbi:radical SAM/SPASM domain-containing protein [Streptomyces spiralis]|uniref:Radical SAM/SPASM domain-containing protein n=1 Tax=Streptomyces spiralis TaxID=66376 RepID=A0A918ZZF9_9ACTN|nr:radical SAM protein [Streptomyces spiralis]GHE80438.1 radical SAM/SPASM domain-containing protein [Streptomyces spiralis]